MVGCHGNRSRALGGTQVLYPNQSWKPQVNDEVEVSLHTARKKVFTWPVGKMLMQVFFSEKSLGHVILPACFFLYSGNGTELCNCANVSIPRLHFLHTAALSLLFFPAGLCTKENFGWNLILP